MSEIFMIIIEPIRYKIYLLEIMHPKLEDTVGAKYCISK